VPLIIPATAGVDPPNFTTFRAPANLLGGYFQVQGNAAIVQLIYGTQGQEQVGPAQSLPTGSYSIGPPPKPLQLIGVRFSNAAAGVGSTFSGYFWDAASPVISYIGAPSTSVVGTITIPRLSAAQFALLTPATNVDQQIVILEVGTDIEWMLQWNTGTQKWDYVGGPPIINEVAADETTASAAYVALATAGPSIAVPRPGDYLVEIGAAIFNTAVDDPNFDARMSYDIGGTGAVDADSIRDRMSIIETGANLNLGGGSFSRQMRKNALTAVTLTAKYKTSANTMHFAQRYMTLLPIAIT
jgi:hypothetical protein